MAVQQCVRNYKLCETKGPTAVFWYDLPLYPELDVYVNHLSMLQICLLRHMSEIEKHLLLAQFGWENRPSRLSTLTALPQIAYSMLVVSAE